MSRLKYLSQAALAYLFFGLFRLLPPVWASNLGASLGRLIGWRHRGTARARKNLQLILPKRTGEHAAIIRGMWANIGRVLGEYPHLKRLWKRGLIELVGIEHLPPLPDKVIFVAAHLANWEVAPLVAEQKGWEMAAIYRPPNNPYIDPLLRRLRKNSGQKIFTKSAEGAMELLRHVRRGGAAGVLVDQRLTDGIAVPFMGQPAMTAPLPAVLAVKYGAKLVPVRVERLGGARLRVTLHPVMTVPEGSDGEKIAALTATINGLFGDWIKERPEQWLWSHRRWRMKKKRDAGI